MNTEEAAIKSFEDLNIWKSAMDLAASAYEFSANLPETEKYGLASQIRRAAASIPTNIAEGWGRGPGPSNANFVRIARGSLYELQTLVLLAIRTGLVPDENRTSLISQIDSVSRLMLAYLRSVEGKSVREAGAPSYNVNGGGN